MLYRDDIGLIVLTTSKPRRKKLQPREIWSLKRAPQPEWTTLKYGGRREEKSSIISSNKFGKLKSLNPTLQNRES